MQLRQDICQCESMSLHVDGKIPPLFWNETLVGKLYQLSTLDPPQPLEKTKEGNYYRLYLL